MNVTTEEIEAGKINMDGEIVDGIKYIGHATRHDGEWRCLAIVPKVGLCLVAVNLRLL